MVPSTANDLICGRKSIILTHDRDHVRNHDLLTFNGDKDRSNPGTAFELPTRSAVDGSLEYPRGTRHSKVELIPDNSPSIAKRTPTETGRSAITPVHTKI